MEYQRDEHRVHLIVYHLIWCPKRRKAVLVGAVAQDCERLFRAKYPFLKRLPSLWTRSYFASAAGHVSQATSQKYIEAQKGV